MFSYTSHISSVLLNGTDLESDVSVEIKTLCEYTEQYLSRKEGKTDLNIFNKNISSILKKLRNNREHLCAQHTAGSDIYINTIPLPSLIFQ